MDVSAPELRAARTVEDILAGHMSSACLIIGHRLGVFSALAERPLSLDELMHARGIENRGVLTKLLEVLIALNLIALEGGRYRNTEIADAALVPGRPAFWGGFIDFFAAQFAAKPIDALQQLTQKQVSIVERPTPAEWRDYMQAMECMSRLSADVIARALPLEDCRTLLDLAGGPGTYAIAFCAAHPKLRVQLFELPHTLALAKPNVDASGFADRIALVPGSMADPVYGRDLDAVFLSQTIHLAPLDAVVQSIRTVYESLAPGGLFIVREVFVEEATRRPLLGSQIGFNMWLQGGAYAFELTERLLRDAGFVEISRVGIRGDDAPAVLGAMVLGRKPR